MLKASFGSAELHQILSNFSVPQILSKIEQRRARGQPVAPPQIRFTQGAVLPIGASALLILTVAPVAFGDEEENRDLGDWKITTTVGYTDAGVVKTVQGTAEVFVTDPVVPEPGSTGLVLIGGGTFWLMRAMRGLRRGDSMSSGNS